MPTTYAFCAHAVDVIMEAFIYRVFALHSCASTHISLLFTFRTPSTFWSILVIPMSSYFYFILFSLFLNCFFSYKFNIIKWRMIWGFSPLKCWILYGFSSSRFVLCRFFRLKLRHKAPKKKRYVYYIDKDCRRTTLALERCHSQLAVNQPSGVTFGNAV